MKIKKLKEMLDLALADNSVGLEDEVIVVGEYNYGIDTCNTFVQEMHFIDSDGEGTPARPVLCIGVDAYLREHEDLGCCDMWVDTEAGAQVLGDSNED